MGMCSLQLLYPSSYSPIRTASDFSWHQDQDFQVKMSLRKCHTFVPNLRAIQQNSSHHSIHQNSIHPSIRHHSNHRYKKCQWYMPVQIPEFPSLSLISNFQDLRDRFSMVCPCATFWHIFFSLLLALSHPWTVTCSVCLCHTIACQCFCVHCSLVENVLHRT